jgi:hypothetical protein
MCDMCAACRDGCTHVLALCSRPYTTGPAWGKYLTRALTSAIKYWLLNPVSSQGPFAVWCCHKSIWMHSMWCSTLFRASYHAPPLLSSLAASSDSCLLFTCRSLCVTCALVL